MIQFDDEENMTEVERYDDEDEFYDDSETEEYLDRCDRCKGDRTYEYVSNMNPDMLTVVPKLKDIACVSVAAALWNHVNIPQAVSAITRKCTKTSQEWKTLRREVLGLSSKLPIPYIVIAQINKYVCKMEMEITNWVSYHFRTVFFKYGPDKLVYSQLHLIVWRLNGTINYVETARNMKTSLRLSEVEKFRFLATYCLKDEMKSMLPELFSKHVKDFVIFDEHPMIYYWCCYFRNELHKATVFTIDLLFRELSIDILMFQHNKVDNWSAKEYFFDRLSSTEQVQEAIWLIDTHGITFQKLILMKLDQAQRFKVYIARSVKIIINYARPRISSKDILSTWLDIRNVITPQQFVSIFRQLLESNVSHAVLTDVWVNASSIMKTCVLQNHEFVEIVMFLWKWALESDFLCTMLFDASSVLKNRIVKKDSFIRYCENLLTAVKISTLNYLLNLCFADAQELMVFKHKLVSNSKSLRDRCLSHYFCGKIECVNFLLVQVLSPYSNLIQDYKKKLLISPDGILKRIITNTAVSDEAILSTWYDICNLITKDQFVLIFRILLKTRPVDSLLQKIWMSLPSSSIRQYVICQNDFEFIQQILNSECWTKFLYHDLLFTFLQDIDENIKKNIAQKQFFVNFCIKLLENAYLLVLNQVFGIFFNDVEESMQFKQNLVFESKFVRNQCVIFCSHGNIGGLNDFLGQLLSPELVLRYKIYLLTSPEGIFKVRTNFDDPISRFEHVLSIWLEICNSINEDQFVFVFNELVKVRTNGEILFQVWNSVEDKFRHHLLNYNDCQVVADVFKLREGAKWDYILLTILQFGDADYRRNLTTKDFFIDHCENLLINDKLPELNALLSMYLQEAEEVGLYLKNLVCNSNCVKDRCLNYYKTGDTKGLNSYLDQLLSSNVDFVSEYKRNLVLSLEGIKKCFKLVFKDIDVVSPIIEDSIPDAKLAARYKQKMIFSSSVIRFFQQMLMTNRLNTVQTLINRYLTSVEDKNSLKKLIFVDPVNLMFTILRNYDEAYWTSVMLWYFGSLPLVENFKKTLAVDRIFDDMLKECVFEKYDRLLSGCRFARTVRFDMLDRFLSWYFQSPNAVSEYKMKRIDFYRNIEVITTLLRRKAIDAYLKIIMKWFFQNDLLKIAEFKTKNKYCKIVHAI